MWWLSHFSRSGVAGLGIHFSHQSAWPVSLLSISALAAAGSSGSLSLSVYLFCHIKSSQNMCSPLAWPFDHGHVMRAGSQQLTSSSLGRHSSPSYHLNSLIYLTGICFSHPITLFQWWLSLWSDSDIKWKHETKMTNKTNICVMWQHIYILSWPFPFHVCIPHLSF